MSSIRLHWFPSSYSLALGKFRLHGQKLLRVLPYFIFPITAAVALFLLTPDIVARAGFSYALSFYLILIGATTVIAGPLPATVTTICIILMLTLESLVMPDPIVAFDYGHLMVIGLFGTMIPYLHTQTSTHQSQIARSEQYFRKLTEQSVHPVILKDAQGKILFTSPSIKSLLGHKHSDFLGNSIIRHVHPKDKKAFKRFYGKMFQTPTRQDAIEVRMKTSDGSWIWVRNHVVNLLYTDGIEAIVGTLQDITEQKAHDYHRQKILKREQKARLTAEEAVRARDEFLSIASHELKTPLSTILLQLQSTLRHILTQSLADFSGEKLVKSLTIAELQSKRLASLIKDLLNVSLISTGKIELDKEHADLTELVSSLVDRMNDQAELAKTPLSLKVHGPIDVHIDVVRIEQCITNLITNAIKFGNKKPIDIEVKKHRSNATITVTDQGVGIDKDLQELIFERFRRANSDEKIKGLGIGLFIAKRIAIAHGGDVSVSSKPSKGSTFTVTLPV